MMTLGPEGVEHQFQVTEQILVLLQQLSLNLILIFIISFYHQSVKGPDIEGGGVRYSHGA